MSKKPSYKKGLTSRQVFRFFNVIFLVLVMLMMIVPILKVLSDSFDASSTYGMTFLPSKFSLEAYKIIFTNKTLAGPFGISVYVTIVGTAIGLFMCTVGAYVLIQEDLPGRKFLSWTVFFTMIFNGGLVPTYLLIRNLGLINNLWAVILPLAINAYNMILMKSFFEQLPVSLFEAADIDGCSPMGIFIKIVLPLSKPALASIGLFYGVEFWNHFFNFQMYITNPNLFNFQMKLRELVLSSEDLKNQYQTGAYVSPNTIKNAAVIVAMLPFMIIYPFCQKYFVTGVTLGAVKE